MSANDMLSFVFLSLSLMQAKSAPAPPATSPNRQQIRHPPVCPLSPPSIPPHKRAYNVGIEHDFQVRCFLTPVCLIERNGIPSGIIIRSGFAIPVVKSQVSDKIR